MRLRDLKLRSKVYGAFAVILSLDIATGLVAIDSLRKVNGEAVTVQDTWLPALGVLDDLLSGVENYRIIEGRALLTQDEEERLASEELLWNARDNIFLLRSLYERLRPHGDKDNQLIETFDTAWRDYQSTSREMLWHVFKGGPHMDMARDIYNKAGERAFRDTRYQLKIVHAYSVDKGRQATEASKRIYLSTVTSIIAATVAAVLLSWLLGVLIAKGVAKPVVRLTGAMRKMAENDLTTPIEIDERRDEIGAMTTTLHELRDRLLERQRLIEDEKESMRKLQSAERELLESGRLAALGRLVAGVSHEINTPLGAAYTVATTLVEAHREFLRLVGDNRLRKSDLDTFVDRVGRASDLIAMTLQKASELIRTFKQVAVDQTSSSRRTFELGELIRQVVLTTSPLFKHRPFTLDVRLDGPIDMDSYPGPLGQVLSNLLSNAITHGLDGRVDGVVTIEAARRNHLVYISVADNGRGILPEHRPHLFEPFFTTRFGQGGSGLGLNIVHGIVTQLLGGAIDVVSTPGEGARFSLTVPAQARPLSEASDPAAQTARQGEGIDAAQAGMAVAHRSSSD